MDIFEILRSATGCVYISDLKYEPYLSRAKEILKHMDLTGRSLRELNDISSYLYKRTFAVADEVIGFLRGRL